MDVTVTGAVPAIAAAPLIKEHGNKLYKVESDLKSAITSAYESLQDTLARNAAVAAKDAADIVYRLHDNIRNVGDNILISTAKTDAKVAESQFALSAQLSSFKGEVANQFAAVALQGEKNTASILTAMSASELRKVQDQLDAEREKSERFRGEVNFGNKFSMIQSQLNDLQQVQHATNQAINFGTGVIGPQSATQNQVR